MSDKLEQACQLLGDRVFCDDEYWYWDAGIGFGREVESDGLLAFALFEVVGTWPKQTQTAFTKRLIKSLPKHDTEFSYIAAFFLNELTPDLVIDAAWETKP